MFYLPKPYPPPIYIEGPSYPGGTLPHPVGTNWQVPTGWGRVPPEQDGPPGSHFCPQMQLGVYTSRF